MKKRRINIEIKILGMGCKNCDTLSINVNKAIATLNIEATVTKITDMPTIAKYGVMRTPALVINEKVVSYGITKEEIMKIIPN